MANIPQTSEYQGSLLRPALAVSTVVSLPVYALFGLTGYLISVPLVYFYLVTSKWFYVIRHTFKRDMKVAYRFVKLNLMLRSMERNAVSVPKKFDKLYRKHPERVAFIMDDKRWTFEQVYELSNKVANYFKKQGYQRGDTIALVMETRVEFVCLWLGLSRIGVVTALVNHNLRKQPLKHCITVAQSKGVIYSTELEEAVTEIKSDLDASGCKYYHFADNDDENSLNVQLKTESVGALDKDMDLATYRDKLIYIYTSGTTGLPKAAIINHSRYHYLAIGVNVIDGFVDDDILYDPLPIYHSAGGILGVGQAILCGHTVVLRKKFSASNYWKDCIKNKCTVAQYIGEICRYLLSVPEKPEDKQHRVRLMFGNGLRPQIWEQFTKRFNIAQVCEFYGATEGNSSLVNLTSKIGAVGFVPNYASAIYPVTIIKCDQITGEIIRGADGFCQRCPPGEPGVLIGKINQKKSINAYQGYADKKESDKKVLRNVFANGDLYFNTGDVLVRDEMGYFYFKDRTGDTFRWRGENVATSEVEAVISNVVGLKDATVYGVDIPNVEGKAGMAAIVDPSNNLDMSAFTIGIKEHLPTYARPLFVRVLSEIPLTGTFKLKKRDLQVEGYDVRKIKDVIYYLNGSSYEVLTESLYDDIISGKARL